MDFSTFVGFMTTFLLIVYLYYLIKKEIVELEMKIDDLKDELNEKIVELKIKVEKAFEGVIPKESEVGSHKTQCPSDYYEMAGSPHSREKLLRD